MVHQPVEVFLPQESLEWFVEPFVHYLEAGSVTSWDEVYFHPNAVLQTDVFLLQMDREMILQKVSHFLLLLLLLCIDKQHCKYPLLAHCSVHPSLGWNGVHDVVVWVTCTPYLPINPPTQNAFPDDESRKLDTNAGIVILPNHSSHAHENGCFEACE